MLEALDAYLTEQNPKLLVLLPVRDEREKPKEGSKEALKPVRSAVLMEVFDPPEQTALMEQKLDVVAAHSATALYNAAEMKRVPLKPLWWPLMQVQQGLGGKARFWTFFTVGTLVLLTLALTLIPYPLKLDAKGKAGPARPGVRVHAVRCAESRRSWWPRTRSWPRGPRSPACTGTSGYKEITELKTERTGLRPRSPSCLGRSTVSPTVRTNRTPSRIGSRPEIELRAVQDKLNNYERELPRATSTSPGTSSSGPPSTGRRPRPGRPGGRSSPRTSTSKVGKTFRPNEPLLRVGDVSGGWEIVLKIPQKHSDQMLKAFKEAAE